MSLLIRLLNRQIAELKTELNLYKDDNKALRKALESNDRRAHLMILQCEADIATQKAIIVELTNQIGKLRDTKNTQR